VLALGFGLLINPEFLSEGFTTSEISNVKRIVIGGLDQRPGDTLVELYRKFHDGACSLS